jgi:hypothetical protein
MWAHEAADTKLIGPKMASVLTACAAIWILAQLAVKYFEDHPQQPVMNPACAEAERLALTATPRTRITSAPRRPAAAPAASRPPGPCPDLEGRASAVARRG